MERAVTDLSSSERYKLLTGIVQPRPIAWITSQNADGQVNLAPFSFFSAAGPNPMSLVFCPVSRRDGSDKDTLRNVLPESEGGLGELVVNASVESLVREIAATAEELPFGESEAELAGLELAKSSVVRPPRVARAPAAFECRTTHVHRIAPGDPFSGTLVVAEVVHVHVDDALLDEAMRVDHEALKTVGRQGGYFYARTRDYFELKSGREALEAKLPFGVD